VSIRFPAVEAFWERIRYSSRLGKVEKGKAGKR
jgi:hypothetical protein